MKKVRVPGRPRCLTCKVLIDGALLTADIGTPSPGDISVCSYCCSIAAYADDLSLRELTPHELAEVLADPGFQMVMDHLKQIHGGLQ